jgi:hypothetical protein
VDNVNGVDAPACIQAAPCKHIQYTVDYLVGSFDFSAQPTIKLVTTGVDYAENVVLPRYVGSLGWRGWTGSFGYPGVYTYPRIQGDPSNNAAVTVRPASNAPFTSVHGDAWIIDSVKVASVDNFCVVSDAGSHLLLQNMNFGNCGLGHMAAEYGGFIETLNGPYTISGSAPYHIVAAKKGTYVSQGNAVTFVGWPSFTYFAAGYNGSMVDAGGISLAAGSGGCSSAHPGTVANDGTSLMYPTSNGAWP